MPGSVGYLCYWPLGALYVGEVSLDSENWRQVLREPLVDEVTLLESIGGSNQNCAIALLEIFSE